MITVIFGLPRSGKTALMTKFALDCMLPQNGFQDVLMAREYISGLNAGGYNFSSPNRHLVYADYDIRYHAYDCPLTHSYKISGFYLGLPQEKHPVQLVPPGSKIFLTEVQRYFNSRQSNTLEDFVSRFYELHGHYYLDIYMDLQRSTLLDLNIREISARFIEILSLSHKLRHGQIVSSTWTVAEFDGLYALEQYLSAGKPATKEIIKQYKYVGNIFEHYTSRNCFMAFLPSGTDLIRGNDFSYEFHEPMGLSVADVQNYKNNNGFDIPDTFRKKRGEK